MAPEQKIAGTARMLKRGRETHPQPSSVPRDRYIAWQWEVELTKKSGLKLEDETVLDEVALTTHQWGYQLMADPTSNRYERPRGVLTYEVGLWRFHVIDGSPFESTLFLFHPVQQWEESCSHLCCFWLAHSINESNRWCPPFSGSHNPTIWEILHLSPAALWWNRPANETNKNFTMSSLSNIIHLAKL